MTTSEGTTTQAPTPDIAVPAEVVEEFSRVEGTKVHPTTIDDPAVEIANVSLWYGRTRALTDVVLRFPATRSRR